MRWRTSPSESPGSEPGNRGVEAASGDRRKAGLAGGDIKRPSGSRPHGPAGVAMARYASFHFLSKVLRESVYFWSQLII